MRKKKLICLAFKIPCHLLLLNQQTAVCRFTGAKTEWKQMQKIFLHNNLQHNQFQFRIVYLQNGLIKHPLHTYSSLVTIHMLILAMFNSTIRILFKIRKDLVAVTMIHNLLHPWTK